MVESNNTLASWTQDELTKKCLVPLLKWFSLNYSERNTRVRHTFLEILLTNFKNYTPKKKKKVFSSKKHEYSITRLEVAIGLKIRNKENIAGEFERGPLNLLTNCCLPPEMKL